MRYKKLLIAITLLLVIFSVFGIIADDQIRPAPQTESRGVGEQIRPANQQSLPSDGNGNYQPTQGSVYSSNIYQAPPVVDIVKLNASLNGVNINSTANSTGNATFVMNKTSNTLTYNISFFGLSSNETSSDISVPGILVNNQSISYSLGLGNFKQGVITFLEEVQSYILEGKAIIKIRSLLFPEGELGGQISNIPLI